MRDKRKTTDTDEELIGTLLAISVVSKRLARKLAEQSKNTEGGKPNERDVCIYRRTAPRCCRY